MVEKKDLRIGNLVLYVNMVFEILALEVDFVRIVDYSVRENAGHANYDELSGIPFSREVLNGHNWFEEHIPDYYTLRGIRATPLGGIPGFLDIDYPWNNSNIARVWLSQDRSTKFYNGSAVSIEYFHQLQNLIYVLSDMEATDFKAL